MPQPESVAAPAAKNRPDERVGAHEKVKIMNVKEDRPLILVVDDYEDNRTTLRLFLERRDYRVVEAADGSEAVKAVLRERPDLILMDISMPVLDGCAAMSRIRDYEEMRDVPIIVLSAHEYGSVDPLLRVDAIRAGLDGYLTKPFDPLELECLVERLLIAKQTTQRLAIAGINGAR